MKFLIASRIQCNINKKRNLELTRGDLGIPEKHSKNSNFKKFTKPNSMNSSKRPRIHKGLNFKLKIVTK